MWSLCKESAGRHRVERALCCVLAHRAHSGQRPCIPPLRSAAPKQRTLTQQKHASRRYSEAEDSANQSRAERRAVQTEQRLNESLTLRVRPEQISQRSTLSALTTLSKIPLRAASASLQPRWPPSTPQSLLWPLLLLLPP